MRIQVVAPGSLGAGRQPEIAAGDLLLRPWRVADAAVIVGAFGDAAISRWHLASVDEAEAKAWLEERDRRWREESGADWAVQAGGEVVARVAVRRLELPQGSAEAAYWTLPGARGRGIAPRALRAMSDWFFRDVGLLRVELEHSTANPASCRVAIKAGFAPEGTRRQSLWHADGWHDMHLHARLAGDADGGYQQGS